MNRLKTAPFLVFEGLDGTGKSTLMAGIGRELERRGFKFVSTREPGGTPLAEEIRTLLLRIDHEVPVPPTEMLLYAASRAQHVGRVIRPSIEAGQWVLCDRFTASSVAFQSFARGLSRADVEMLNRFACQEVRPSLTVLLDLDVELSFQRRANRSDGDRMEREAKAFHESVRQGYLAQAKEAPGEWLVLDARETPAQLLERTLKELESRGWLS